MISCIFVQLEQAGGWKLEQAWWWKQQVMIFYNNFSITQSLYSNNTFYHFPNTLANLKRFWSVLRTYKKLKWPHSFFVTLTSLFLFFRSFHLIHVLQLGISNIFCCFESVILVKTFFDTLTNACLCNLYFYFFLYELLSRPPWHYFVAKKHHNHIQ